MADDYEFSLCCAAGHSSYVRLRLMSLDDVKFAPCPSSDTWGPKPCGAPRYEVDRKAPGDSSPLMRRGK